MSKSIDNKVVSMEFDNSKFEKPAKESISTLDKLKEALHFKNVEQGFEAMNTAIKKVTFDPLAKGLDTVYAKFTFFERFTIQLYDRLANKIIDTGRLIARETFTTPISSGKSEYEEKMGSVQTIMASTGEELKTVNKYLNELNKYSDDTIYSFRDMTTNIGKFTNAGVKLEDAVAAIKGVSNEAARSGANANEASRAMYNFAQALSTGSVKLIDWKSIENANMATVEFKNELLKTAEAFGTVTKTSEGMYKTMKGHAVSATKGFNDNLSDAWLTSEVLIETLKKYADETTDIGKASTAAATEVKTFTMLMDTLKEALQSGWAESWEYIFGDFEKAKKLWTDLSKVLGGLIDRMSTTRNAILKVWNEIGGRDAMLKSFSNMWKALTSILGAVRDGFRMVFPPKTGEDLANLTKRFERFTRTLKPTPETIDKLRRTFAGLFSALAIVGDAFRAFASVILPLARKALGFITGELLGGTRSLGNWVINLRESIKEGRVFERVFGKVGNVLSWVGSRLKAAFLAIKDIIFAFKNGGLKAGFGAIKDAFVDLFSYIWDFIKKHNPITFVKDLGVKIGEAIYDWPVGKAIVDFVKSIRDTIANSSVWKFCVKVVNGFIDAIQSAINRFRGVDTSATEEFTENVKEGFHPLEAIKNFFVKIWHGILAVWEWIGPVIKGFGKAIKTAFSGLFKSIKGVVDRSDLADAGVFGAGTGLGMMMASIATFVLNLSKTVKNAGSTVRNLKRLTDGLRDLLHAFKVEAYAKAIKDTAISIGILAASLFVLSALPPGPMAQATGAILMLFGALTKMMKSLNTLNAASTGQAGILLTFGVQLALMAAAIGVLTVNMLILALVPYGAILKGLAVIVLMMRALTSSVKDISNATSSGKSIGAILGLTLFIQMLLVPLSILSLVAHVNPGGLMMASAVIILLLGVITAIAVGLSAAGSQFGRDTIKVGGIFIGIMFMLNSIIASIVALAVTVAGLDLAKKTGAIVVAFKMVGAFFKSLVKFVASLAIVTTISSKAGSLMSALQIRTRTGTEIKSLTSRQTSGTSKTGLGIFTPVLGALLGLSVAIIAISGAISLLAIATSFIPMERVDKIAERIMVMISITGLIMILAMAVSKASNKFNASANVAFKDNKIAVSLFPKLVSYILAASVMIVAVAAAAKIISNVDAASIWAAIGITAAVFALITAFGVLSSVKGGFGERFSKGLATAGGAITSFAKAVMMFMVVVGILLAGVALMIHTTDQDFNSFAEMLSSHKEQIVNVATDIIEIALTAALRSVFTALQTLSVETIRGLVQLIDTLIDEGPELVARLLILIGVVLDGIVDKAPEITEKLVQAIIAIVHGLGKAIVEHSTEIVEAVDKVIEAITSVWVKGIGKLFGISNEYLDGAAESVMGIAKPITLIGGGALTAMSSFNKFATSIKTFGQHISDIKGKVGGAINSLKYFYKYSAAGIEHYGGLINYLKSPAFANFGSIPGILSKITGFVAAHPFAVLAVGAGIAFKKIIDGATESMKVITDSDKKVSEALKPLLEEEQKLNDIYKERKESYKDIDDEGKHNERVLETLREMVDQNGRIKAGYETRVGLIQNQLAGVLNIEVDAQTQMVSVIDDQNNKLDIQSKKIDEIMQKKRLQAKMEKAEEQVAETREKLESGYYAKEEAKVLDARKKYAETLTTLKYHDADTGALKTVLYTNEALARMYEEFNELRNGMRKGGLSDAQRKHYYELESMLHQAEEEYGVDNIFLDRAAAIGAFDSTISTAKENTVKATAAVKNVDKAWEAMDGTLEDAKKAIAGLDFELILSDAGASVDQVIAQFSNYTKEIGDLIASGANVSPETIQRYENLFNTLAENLGDSEEGRAYLRSVGYTDADEWIKGYEERVSKGVIHSDEIEKQVIEGMFNEWKTSGYKATTLLGGLIGHTLEQSTKDELVIRSPSKVFADIGKNTVFGLINGVSKNENALEKTYSAMAASNVAAYTAAMSKGQSSIPFTPVFNANGIQNGTSLIQRQLNGLTTNPIGATLTSRLAASVDTSQIGIDNSKIISSIADLKQGLLDLGETMANLQVVMDTGATVGALAPGMDMELGRRTVRKQRGV